MTGSRTGDSSIGAALDEAGGAVVITLAPGRVVQCIVGVSAWGNAAQTGVMPFVAAVILRSTLVRCLLDAPDEAAGIDAVRALAQDLRAGVERTK